MGKPACSLECAVLLACSKAVWISMESVPELLKPRAQKESASWQALCKLIDVQFQFICMRSSKHALKSISISISPISSSINFYRSIYRYQYWSHRFSIMIMLTRWGWMSLTSRSPSPKAGAHVCCQKTYFLQAASEVL